MKTTLSVLTNICLLLGALTGVSFAVDVGYLIKKQLRGPHLEMGVPSTLPDPAYGSFELRPQQAERGSADTVCTSLNQSDVVMHTGVGLKGQFALKNGG